MIRRVLTDRALSSWSYMLACYERGVDAVVDDRPQHVPPAEPLDFSDFEVGVAPEATPG